MNKKCMEEFDVNSERCANCEELLECSQVFFDFMCEVVNGNNN